MNELKSHQFKNKFTGEFDRLGNPIFNGDVCVIRNDDKSSDAVSELQFNYLGNEMIRLLSKSATLAHLNSFSNYSKESIVDITQQNVMERYRKNENAYPRSLYIICVFRRVPHELIGIYHVTANWTEAYEYWEKPIKEDTEFLTEVNCTSEADEGLLYKEMYKVYEFMKNLSQEHIDY